MSESSFVGCLAKHERFDFYCHACLVATVAKLSAVLSAIIAAAEEDE